MLVLLLCSVLIYLVDLMQVLELVIDPLDIETIRSDDIWLSLDQMLSLLSSNVTAMTKDNHCIYEELSDLTVVNV